MPAGNGLRLHNYQHLGPPPPDAAQGRPEQPVQLIQPRTWPFALEDSDLLTQRKNLDCQVTPAAEEDSDGGQESKDQFEHEHYVLTRLTPPTEIG